VVLNHSVQRANEKAADKLVLHSNSLILKKIVIKTKYRMKFSSLIQTVVKVVTELTSTTRIESARRKRMKTANDLIHPVLHRSGLIV
jgi:hypothetical protein